MVRGINRQNIFIDNEDNEKFLETLNKYRVKVACEIYAYCLMGNHIHLLIKEGNESLSNTMRRIGASYVYWHNWQYDRKGHLFQDRYKSEPVEEDTYFLTCLRYIHQNPLQAGFINNIELYKWSSYREYLTESKIVDVDFALNMFHPDRKKAVEKFIEFNKAVNSDKCLEMTAEKKTVSDKEVKKIALNKYNIELSLLHKAEKNNQIEIIKYLKGMEGVSLRQLARLTGFTVHRIQNF